MCEHIDYKGEGFFITYSYSTTITHLIFYLLYSNEQLQIIRIIDVLRGIHRSQINICWVD